MSHMTTRAECGLGGLWSPDMRQVSNVFIHHSVMNGNTSACEALRSLEHHALALNHRAIDYSFVLGQHWRVEGRGWGRSGGHTLNNNSTSYGICGHGDFRYDPITDELIGYFAETIREGIAGGWIVPRPNILPHYSVFPTACPARLAAVIPEIARRVASGGIVPVDWAALERLVRNRRNNMALAVTIKDQGLGLVDAGVPVAAKTFAQYAAWVRNGAHEVTMSQEQWAALNANAYT